MNEAVAVEGAPATRPRGRRPTQTLGGGAQARRRRPLCPNASLILLELVDVDREDMPSVESLPWHRRAVRRMSSRKPTRFEQTASERIGARRDVGVLLALDHPLRLPIAPQDEQVG